MNSDSSTTSAKPGYTIGALAFASGTDFVDAALGLATILGGIAGPHGGIDGPAGDLIHPGINLITAGRDHAPWRGLEELLLAPVDTCQRMLRNLSHATGPDRLDHMEFAHVGDHTGDIAETSNAGLVRTPGRPEYVDERRHLSILRTPSFLLRAPNGETLVKALPEVLDAHAFLVYEDLFAKLLAEDAKEKHRLSTYLPSAVTGRDEFVARDKRSGPGGLDTVRANLLITTTREQIGEALASDHAAVQTLLRHSVLLDPASTGPTAPMDLQNVRWGYQAYYRTVKEVIDARRAGSGFQIGIKPEAAAALHAFTGELQEWCRHLPAHLQPYFSGTLSLPYRLHWVFVATIAPREIDEWVLPFTQFATRQVLARQQQLLDGLLTDAEHLEHRRARVAMLWKLSDKPLSMRDLLRRHTVQRRDVHEPVLNELVSENLVTRHPDGLLELTTEGRRQLVAA